VCTVSFCAYMALRRTRLYRFYLVQGDAGAGKSLYAQSSQGDNAEGSLWSDALAVYPASVDAQPLHLNWKGLLAVLQRIRSHAFAVAMCFVVTLGLFPSITGTVLSVSKPRSDGSGGDRIADPTVFVLVHFLVFNLGDYVGRYIPLIHAWLRCSTSMQVLMFSLVRLLFVPLVFLCNVTINHLMPAVVIKSDAAYFVILAIFAITNGWLGTVCMMSAPKRVRSARDEALVGMVMSFVMTLGMTIGSFASFGIRGLLCQCNPFVS